MKLPHAKEEGTTSEKILPKLEGELGATESTVHNTQKTSLGLKQLTQNQLIGGLTLILLIVGAVTGAYLGTEQQDNRQRAVVDEVYPTQAPTTVPVNPTATIESSGPNPDIPTCYKGDDVCKGKQNKNSCGTVQAPAHCVNLPYDPFSLPLSGICVCTSDPTPAPTTILDNGCDASGGTCRAPGTCLSNEIQIKLCSGAGSGPVCCKRAVVATATPLLISTSTPAPTDPTQPTSTPITNNPTSVQSTGIPATKIPTQQVNTATPSGPTVTNPPPMAPVCSNVTINNSATSVANTPPAIGNVITLTCSQVTGATHYEFRMKLPDGTLTSIEPSVSTITVSKQFPITVGGAYVAQCTPCDATSCAEWEN